MKCTVCGNSMEKTTTTFMVSRHGFLYVVEDVPCFECSVCEHIVFEQSIAKQLEQYSSGKFYPSRYRQAFVFKWNEPILEVPLKPLEVSLSNEHLDLSILGTGR